MHSATWSLIISIIVASIFGSLTYINFTSASNALQEVTNVQHINH